MSELIEESDNKDLIIVSFGGFLAKEGLVLPFEFFKITKELFPKSSRAYYRDFFGCWYHKGFCGLTSTIESSIQHLANVIKPYRRAIFIGNSAGGYAAILFGSILNISDVIAFYPQTIIDSLKYKYHNLRTVINSSTNYYIYGHHKTKVGLHAFFHLKNIQGESNVKITNINKSVKELRDNGDLKHILTGIINPIN